MSLDQELDQYARALDRPGADLIRSALDRYHPRATKAGAILRGAPTPADGEAAGWFAGLKAWKVDGDPDAANYVKAILGTSAATGQAIAPNNFVARVVEHAGRANPWRQLITYRTVNAGFGVDVPYVVDAHQNALLQGAFGSNKDNRDFAFAAASATLYTIAQIVDVSNQLLRASEGAAEEIVAERIGTAIGMAEGNFVVNGSGSSQPLGILPAIMAFGDIAATKYTLNSETRAAALANAMGKLEAYGREADAIVLHPTDYFETITETHDSGAGGWAVTPLGPTGQATSLWGVPVFRDSSLPVGTGLVGAFRRIEAYVTGELQIDISREAGNRFDQNLTGYRGEIGFGFNATPFVRTGHVIKVLGL